MKLDPPKALDAEKYLIGASLLDHTVVARVDELVQPGDFYHPLHAGLWRALLALDLDGKRPEPLLVEMRIKADAEAGLPKTLEGHGGVAYLAGLTNEVVTTENVDYYAKQVRATAIRRKLLEAGGEIQRTVLEEDDAEAVAARAEELVLGVAQQVTSTSWEAMRTLVHKSVETIARRADKKQAVTGIPTGLTEVDALTAGFQPSDLIIVAGRPSMGKSALAMNAAQHAAIRYSVPVLVFSLEMSKESLTERGICSQAQIDSGKIRNGSLGNREWIAITKACGELSTAPLWIDDSGGLTMRQIRSKARRWRAMNTDPEKPGLVVVDYLQLVAPDAPAKGADRSNREREIAEISRGLKALAKELRVPIVALSQLNRGVEMRADKRPMLSDLRESGAIEQDADVIAFIYRDEVYNKNTDDKGIAEIIIGKQRNGSIGTVKVAFRPFCTRFDNLSVREEGPRGPAPGYGDFGEDDERSDS